MSQITRIEVQGFRAFPGDWSDSFVLAGSRNLLLHGENGSGKTSLGLAIRDLLDDRPAAKGAVSFSQVKNEFDPPGYTGGHVTLRFDDATPPLSWKSTDAAAGNFRPTAHPLWDAMARSAAWMDYLQLRTIYEAGPRNFLADLFPICRDLLLADVPVSAADPTPFAEEWQAIVEQANEPRDSGKAGSRQLSAVLSRIYIYNGLLAAFLVEWQATANQLLRKFVAETTLHFDALLGGDYRYVAGRRAGYKLSTPRIRLHIRQRGYEPPNPVIFLNEARLTASGLALWLAALLRTRPRTLAPGQTYPRVLVLDDVLLSLDMDHRLPLIEVLKKHFDGWQVFLLTHDPGWFEIAKSHLNKWAPFHLYTRSDGTRDFPIVRPASDFLTRANQHFTEHDYKAAGVYLRSAFELMLREFAEKHHVPVRYADRRKDLTTDDFWPAVERSTTTKLGELIVPESLSEEVRRCRTHVLNPLCHDADHLPLPYEIRSTLEVLRALRSHLIREQPSTKYLTPLQWTISEILAPRVAFDPCGSALALRALFHTSLANLCHRHSVPVPYRRVRGWPETSALWHALLSDARNWIAPDPTLQAELTPHLCIFLMGFDVTVARSRLPTAYYLALRALCGPFTAFPRTTRFDAL